MRDQKLIDEISCIIKCGLEDDRRKLFQIAQSSKIIDPGFALRLWYEQIKVEKCNNDQLREVAKAWIKGYRPEDQDYSDDPKAGFLDSMPYHPHKSAYTQNIFKRFEPFENKHNLDVSMFDRDDAIQMLRELRLKSRDQVSRVLSTLSQYSKWRRSRGMQIGEAFVGEGRIMPRDIGVEDGETSQFIKSAEELSERIETEAYCLEDVAPVAICLAWMGFTMKEMVNLRNEDVNVFGRDVKSVLIPAELIQFFELYEEVDEKEVVGGFGARVRYREDLGYFLKRWVSKPSLKRMTEVTVRDSFKQFESMTYTSVRLSGIMHRLYLREQLNGRLTQDDFIEICQLSKESRTSKNIVENKMFVYAEYKKITQ